MSATSTALSTEKHRQGIHHFREGRLEEALQLLGEALAEGETGERWNDWAAVQLAAKNPADAEKALRRALKLEPQNLQWAANLGGVLMSLGKPEEAMPLLERSEPGLAADEKAIVSQLLLQCRRKSDALPRAPDSSADEPASISQILAMQASALNSLALRQIAMEEAFERLDQSLALTRAQQAPQPARSAASQFLHRPSTNYAVTAAKTEGSTQPDLKLVERLMAAYRLSAAEFDGIKGSMWRDFFDQRHQAAHSAFTGAQTDLAAAILRNPVSSDLFWGFDGLTSTKSNMFVLSEEVGMVMDHLIRLSEAVGAQPLENPLAYVYRGDAPTVLDATSADSTIHRIETTLGCTLSFPNPYPEERGLLTSRGIISYRAVPALYQASRIKQLLKGIAQPRVLEIGAGLGRAAYFASQLGIRDYTIIDIPMTAICSGYFLGRVLGEEAVQLAGEDFPESEGRIRILPPSGFLESRDRYDLVLNADSFVELDESVAQKYWSEIESRAGIFLSINHEANAHTVRQFIESSPRIETYDRNPYWIQKGYVEETARFKRDR